MLSRELTSFQRDILWLVAEEGAPAGVDIRDRLSECQFYKREINHGRLYPNLDTLVDLGLLNKFEKDRRTNGYRISSKGQRWLDMRAEWVDEKHQTITA